MEHSVIVTTPAELRAAIAEEIGAVIPKLADFRRKNEAVETDGMTVEDAARFLTEQGIPTTRASLYNLIYKRAIPHRKIGRRVVFSKKELREWLDDRAARPCDAKTEARSRIAASVNRK